MTTACIRQHNGVPTLFINGEPHSAFSYMTYHPEQHYFDDVSEHGFTLFSIPANADAVTIWGNQETWVDEDVYDYSYEDRLFEMILEHNPNAYIFPRVHTTGARWWLRQHPEEVSKYRTKRGKDRPYLLLNLGFPSWASEEGRAICREAVRRYVEHVRSSRYADRVIGYMVCSWLVGEWMTYEIDTSAPNIARFRDWLRHEYRSVDRLRAAWDNKRAAFETANVPATTWRRWKPSLAVLADPKHRPVVDYWRYYGTTVSDALLDLAAETKRTSNQESVVGAFFGYLLQFGADANLHGHIGLPRVLASHDIDFLSSPSCYSHRSLTHGYSYFMSLVDAVKLHGKMWWNENDYRTFMAHSKGENPERWSASKRNRYFKKYRAHRFVGFNESVEESISYQVRETANCLGSGSGMWFFDMGGGWYAHPKMMDTLEQLRMIAEKSLTVDRSSVSEICVLTDVHGMPWSPVHAHAQRMSICDQMPLLGSIGAPFSLHLLEDLPDLPDHKLWIIWNAFALSEQERAAINQRLKQDNHWIIWVYAPGLVKQGRLSEKSVSVLTGINVGVKQIKVPFLVTITEPAHPLTLGLEGTAYGGMANAGARARTAVWANRDPRAGYKAYDDWREAFGGCLVEPAVYIKDDEADILGYLPTISEPGLAVKQMGTWTSILSTVAPLPTALLRNIARAAGVHLYVESGEQVYANRSFVTVSTNEGGIKRVRLPRKSDVVDAFTGETLARQATMIDLPMERASTRILFVGDAEDWCRAAVR